MKYIESNNFQVVDEPFNAIEEIRQRSNQGHTGEEALYICNVSNIINKHRIWKQCMPRVIPYYGESEYWN